MNQNTGEERFEKRFDRYEKKRDKGHVWGGLLLLLVGALLLAREAGVYFPNWFFSWPMIPILVGLMGAIKERFRPGGWIFVLLVGGLFLAGKIVPGLSLTKYIWPIIIITVGLIFIFKPKHRHCYAPKRKTVDGDIAGTPPVPNAMDDWQKAMEDRADVIDVTAIFGGVKKNMLTKNFRGGDVVAFMGGTEINLSQADFEGKVIIDNVNIFGGTKLIVPPDWDVQSQVVAIFGGVDDKRPPSTHVNRDKVLFLDGTCIFGGVEIRSF